jgi:hypothetical protein
MERITEIVENITAVANRGEHQNAQYRPKATQTTEVLWPFVGHRHNNEEY